MDKILSKEWILDIKYTSIIDEIDMMDTPDNIDQVKA